MMILFSPKTSDHSHLLFFMKSNDHSDIYSRHNIQAKCWDASEAAQKNSNLLDHHLHEISELHYQTDYQTGCYDLFHAQSQTRPCACPALDRSRTPMFHHERTPRRVASCDPLPSHTSAYRTSTSWYTRPLVVHAVSRLPCRLPVCIKSPPRAQE